MKKRLCMTVAVMMTLGAMAATEESTEKLRIFPTVSKGLNTGFCQLLIAQDGQQRPISERMKKNKNVYRALCEKDGKLCLIMGDRNKTISVDSGLSLS